MPASRTDSIPLGKLLILAVALATAGAGVVHLGVAGQHLDHPYLVASFLAIGIAQVGLSGALGMRPSRRVLGLIVLADLGILAVWAATRATAVPFVPGLEEPQPIGLADVVVLILETGAIAAAGMALVLPKGAARSLVAAGRRIVVAVGAVVLALMVPGLIAPHSHVGGHGHGSTEALAEHGHDKATSPAAGHGHDALTYEQAHETLTAHGHAPSKVAGSHPGHDVLSVGPHLHDSPAAPHGHAPGTPGTPGHDHGTEGVPRTERTFLKLGGGRGVYQPADEDHGAAIRWHDANQDGHHGYHGDCKPTASQKAAADRLVSGTRETLRPYDNNPWRALRDGFYAFPIPQTKMFHMVATRRFNDGRLLDPARIESFMYAMTDKGLTAVGGMFIDADKEATPPNPTGCLMIWHNHTNAEGVVTSFDPEHPTRSVWMAHVWTFGDLEPWGRDMDGSEPHAWFFGYRYVPAVCNDDGECI